MSAAFPLFLLQGRVQPAGQLVYINARNTRQARPAHKGQRSTSNALRSLDDKLEGGQPRQTEEHVMVNLEMADSMRRKDCGGLAAVADMPVEEPGKIPESDQRWRGGARRDERLVEGIHHIGSNALKEESDVAHIYRMS